ncbi:hypothetical protein CB1_001616030 [Camelus ferus]|nr:hypothetical protein CB1_001616030 [Camelus ferus]
MRAPGCWDAGSSDHTISPHEGAALTPPQPAGQAAIRSRLESGPGEQLANDVRKGSAGTRALMSTGIGLVIKGDKLPRPLPEPGSAHARGSAASVAGQMNLAEMRRLAPIICHIVEKTLDRRCHEVDDGYTVKGHHGGRKATRTSPCASPADLGRGRPAVPDRVAPDERARAPLPRLGLTSALPRRPHLPSLGACLPARLTFSATDDIRRFLMGDASCPSQF